MTKQSRALLAARGSKEAPGRRVIASGSSTEHHNDVQRAASGNGSGGKFVDVYPYVDEDGGLLFEVCRTADKRFLQRRRDAQGGFVWSLDGVRRPVYRLPEVLAAIRDGGTVYVVEGEKDADTLAINAGVTATCNPGGAGKWTDEHSETIQHARRIVVVVDRDDDSKRGLDGLTPGEKHAREIRESLARVGRLSDVDFVAARDGKDAHDHVVAGFEPDDFVPYDLDAFESQAAGREIEFVPLSEFVVRDLPAAEPLLGTTGEAALAVGSLLLLYGAEGTGKSTLSVDAIAHLAAGEDWLGLRVPRPVRVLVIENEGPPALFQRKLEAKAATWRGPDWSHNVHVFAAPWGEFSFSDPAARARLAGYCDAHEIELVCANPTLGIGAPGSGRPDETQQFVDWLVECGLKTTRAFWLLHHENKAGQISGDWGRHADTKVQLQPDGGNPRTKITWEKVRWSTELNRKTWLLDWIVDTQSYRVLELDTAGATDQELDDAIEAFLRANPYASTTKVGDNVTGTRTRISKRLTDSPRFDAIEGKRHASLWFVTDTDEEDS